jgi:hypothetical protein
MRTARPKAIPSADVIEVIGLFPFTKSDPMLMITTENPPPARSQFITVMWVNALSPINTIMGFLEQFDVAFNQCIPCLAFSQDEAAAFSSRKMPSTKLA